MPSLELGYGQASLKERRLASLAIDTPQPLSKVTDNTNGIEDFYVPPGTKGTARMAVQTFFSQQVKAT